MIRTFHFQIATRNDSQLRTVKIIEVELTSSQTSNISDLFSSGTYQLMKEEIPSLESHMKLLENDMDENWNAVDLSIKRIDNNDDVESLQEFNSSFLFGEDYDGMHSFKIHFDEPEKITKSMKYTFSKKENMLFAQNGVICDTLVQTSGVVPSSSKLFVSAVYTGSDHQDVPVLRCPHHFTKLDDNSDHFILVNNLKAEYGKYIGAEHNYVAIACKDISGGHSIFTVPLEFTCLSTCMGGIGQKPFKIVFLLVDRGRLLGRKCIPARISRCPGRSRMSAESKYLESNKRKIEMKENNSELLMVPNPKHRRIIQRLLDVLESHSDFDCKCQTDLHLSPGYCILNFQ
ncbi:hypothetical protein HELRODRAFT_107137 [Helobdella robusta]|uniref:p53 DNA-binding domain-containing protein n=1 Tax=Helobdella robusta TaxID=6412 RepID=T1EE77_HELRO|nr:hypothetical protein HELRODRAFT_107137 [Helobdella robusta]ESN99038.1 hypothetical protein HELRODRAFT_107137 [Helobdella robusta]